MNKQEQDKLWAELSEESKKRIRKEYWEANLSSIENITAKTYENLFGEHNLQPAMTYEDIIREIDKNSYISPINGEVYSSKEQVKKENAIHKLLNVAKFLNKNEDGSDWVPDFKNKDENNNKIWSLGIDEDDNKIRPYYVDLYGTRSEIVYFRTEEIAEQAVQILGKDCIHTTLTPDY